MTHEYQSFNNCGPANLSMLLRYWDWVGDQRTTQALLHPNQDDANVMPEEMAAYVEEYAGLKAMLRVGGSLNLIKQFISAGFPLIMETGHQPSKEWWMGQYILVNGYDDNRSVLITQESLIMQDLHLPYAEIEAQWWRDFNNVFLIVYPPDRESEVAAILGAQ